MFIARTEARQDRLKAKAAQQAAQEMSTSLSARTFVPFRYDPCANTSRFRVAKPT